MNKRKIAFVASIALALIMVMSLAGFTSPGSSIVPGGPVLAAGGNNGNNGNGNGGNPPPPPNPHGKVKPSERQAAANNRLASLQATGQSPSTANLVIDPTTGQLVPDYFGFTPNYANSPLPTVDPNTLAVTGGIQKFVDALPAIPVAVAEIFPATTTAPEADYYEIAAVQYTQVMNSSLSATPTALRGYVQVETPTFEAAHPGVSAHYPLTYPDGSPIYYPGTTTQVLAVAAPKYLGPIIVAQRDRPVRILFDNYLPSTDNPGYLYVPVDTTYLGAGNGYNGATGGPSNRAVIHLHGGVTPWISDGTPQQDFSPGNEVTGFTKGQSFANVPDMPIPPDGSVTLYYTNHQSARLMFYHDHALALTRLNVYDGMAAGYLLQDAYEDDLEDGTSLAPGFTNQWGAVLPPDNVELPLVIQDKTFVPDTAQLNAEDPTWDTAKWGGLGSLWFPHVYMPNQNPYDVTGANAMGRWDYGPWFWPPFTGILNGPIVNPYGPLVDPNAPAYEPPYIPGTPNVSGTPESFMDTPVVNGMAYPVLNVDPKAYRFQILNAANDRYWNLQLYQATAGIISSVNITAGGTGYSAPVVTFTGNGIGATATATVNATGSITAINMITVGSGYTTATVGITDPTGSGFVGTAIVYTAPTEVGMVPASQTAGIAFPPAWTEQTAPYTPDILDNRTGGVPDPNLRGPAMVQVGNEGGFLPEPALLLNTPIGYEQNKRNIVVLNTKQHTLFLGPAERADVVIDFSNFAGKTLILYNDSPAPVPAGDPRNDYYTGDLDQTSTGGAPSTQPGYGPNTRTIMQIVVSTNGGTSTAPVDDYNATNFSALQAALPAVFAASQDTIIVPQTAYQAAYPTAVIPAANDATQFVKIQDTSLSFTPIGQTSPITIDMGPKAIQELFTVDYGRMNATLGVEIPFTNMTNQTTIPYGFIDPPTELVEETGGATLIGTLGDGTQIWKVTHNGVDTHVIHVHLFNAQLINRVGWDGAIYPPDPNELGWKETFRMNPLQDAIIALRPITFSLPFELPNSVRLLDPSRPSGSTGVQFFNVDPNGIPVTTVNEYINFGEEYVWHCHILGHEENDMMRSIVVGRPPAAPASLSATLAKNKVTLTWIDSSISETNFLVQVSHDGTTWTTLATLPGVAGKGSALTYIDSSYSSKNAPYYYQVIAVNNLGATQSSGFTAPSPGFPMLPVSSAPAVVGPPAGTTTLLSVNQATATKSPVIVTWSYSPAGDQTGFTIQRATDVNFTNNVKLFTAAANASSFSDTTTKGGTTYYYRVAASNALGNGAWSNSLSITPHN